MRKVLSLFLLLGIAGVASAQQPQASGQAPKGSMPELSKSDIDMTKLESLGFRNTRNFDSALELTVKWYLEHESWWRAIKEKSAEYKAYYEKQYTNR